MRRREFIAALGGAAAWPLISSAQGGRRIGVMMGLGEDDPETKARLAKLRQELSRLGWSDGANLRIDTRFAPVGAQASTLAKELVALRPEVILAHSSQIVAALRRETGAIPIVFVNISDPIGAGLVVSLARPGGNLTGLLHYEEGIIGKWLALLREISPRVAKTALVASPKSLIYNYFLRNAQSAGATLGIEVMPGPVESAADIERFFQGFPQSDGSILVPPEITTITHRDLIVALAAKHRLPAIYPFRQFVVAGGLMSYGTDQIDMFGRTASYIDRILRGTPPADLPVQAPTKYETVLNLKTAKTLGLTVPDKLLVAADEVIE